MDSGDGGTDSWPGQWEGQECPDDDGDDGAGIAGRGASGGGRKTDGGRGTSSGSERSGPLARARWLATTDEEWVAFVREVVSSLAIVAAIGLLLFAVSGLWPPMVAIESPSMAPNMQTGDLVFVMEEHRFAGGAARGDTGVVPHRAGAAAGYKEFNEYGDVIVYRPDGDPNAVPIIHRARFWVNDGENWYDKANQAYLGGAENCEELANCPAPHGGFITKGDNNGLYDQVGSYEPISSPVKPSWVTGTAEFRIPWLGRIRLLFGTVNTNVAGAGTVSAGFVGVWTLRGGTAS